MKVIRLLLAVAQLALTVLAANQGEAHHPAHNDDRPLRWSSMLAGLFNSTPGVSAFTSPVTGVSMSVLPISAGSISISHTSSLASSTSTPEKPFPMSIVTVTDRTTVTETSCSESSSPINSFATANTLPTSLSGDVVKTNVQSISSVPKTNLAPAVNTLGTTVLPSNPETSNSAVVMITKTAWTTTWTSITAQSDVPVSSPAKASHSSAIGGKPQQPIDQVYANFFPSPTTTPMKSLTPVLTNSTASRTSNGTSSLAVSISHPTDHTALPIFGTAGTRIPKASQSLPPVPKIPIIPNLPFGHPPLFSNATIVRSYTTVSFYHEKPTIHPGAASISKAHATTAKASSISHPVRKCTTTFLHSPTQPCTITSYAHTKTIAVDCHGCVGEQAQVTKGANREGKICNASTVATITLPVSNKSVCAGPMVATGGSMHPKGKPSSNTHVGSSGFVTSTSVGAQGSGYGHGNWTSRD